MNDSLEIIKDIYKPYKYTIINNAYLFNTTMGNIVVKKKNNDIKKIYNYLSSRGFLYFPKLLDEDRSDYNIFEYVNDTDYPLEQKSQDMINLISLLHNKTTYYKVVSKDNFKSIYEDILSNINYLDNYYNELFNNIINEEYMRPSYYLVIRNISKIFSALEFSKKELDIWLNNSLEENKTRVCLIHNNLSIDHFKKYDKDYLISWDKAKIDSPILDIINFYKNNYFDLEFETLLELYFKKFSLSDNEKKLMFVIMALPPKISFLDNEFDSCKSIREKLDYIFKTEKLIRPYYSVE